MTMNSPLMLHSAAPIARRTNNALFVNADMRLFKVIYYNVFGGLTGFYRTDKLMTNHNGNKLKHSASCLVQPRQNNSDLGCLQAYAAGMIRSRAALATVCSTSIMSYSRT